MGADIVAGTVLEIIAKEGGTLRGETRFQKLVFLSAHEFGVPLPFAYWNDNYGPFSGPLKDFLYELERKGFIEIDRSSITHTFKLTEGGRELLSRAGSFELPDELFGLTTTELKKRAYEVRDRLEKIRVGS